MHEEDLTQRTPDEGSYYIWLREDRPWPVIVVPARLIPGAQRYLKPAGSVSVLKMGKLEFAWAPASALIPFDIKKSSIEEFEDTELKAAYLSIIGKSTSKAHATFPSLKHWECVLRQKREEMPSRKELEAETDCVRPSSSRSSWTRPKTFENPMLRDRRGSTDLKSWARQFHLPEKIKRERYTDSISDDEMEPAPVGCDVNRRSFLQSFGHNTSAPIPLDDDDDDDIKAPGFVLDGRDTINTPVVSDDTATETKRSDKKMQVRGCDETVTLGKAPVDHVIPSRSTLDRERIDHDFPNHVEHGQSEKPTQSALEAVDHASFKPNNVALPNAFNIIMRRDSRQASSISSKARQASSTRRKNPSSTSGTAHEIGRAAEIGLRTPKHGRGRPKQPYYESPTPEESDEERKPPKRLCLDKGTTGREASDTDSSSSSDVNATPEPEDPFVNNDLPITPDSSVADAPLPETPFTKAQDLIRVKVGGKDFLIPHQRLLRYNPLCKEIYEGSLSKPSWQKPEYTKPFDKVALFLESGDFEPRFIDLNNPKSRLANCNDKDQRDVALLQILNVWPVAQAMILSDVMDLILRKFKALWPWPLDLLLAFGIDKIFRDDLVGGIDDPSNVEIRQLVVHKVLENLPAMMHMEHADRAKYLRKMESCKVFAKGAKAELKESLKTSRQTLPGRLRKQGEEMYNFYVQQGEDRIAGEETVEVSDESESEDDDDDSDAGSKSKDEGT